MSKTSPGADSDTATSPRVITSPVRVWNQPKTWRNHPSVPDYGPLPKAHVLLVQSLRLLWQHKKLFGGLAAVYGVLNLLLVRGLAGSADVSTIKELLSGNVPTFVTQLQSSVATFMYILGTAGSATTEIASLYQSILLLLCGLAIIWALRQVLAGHSVTIKASFYQGMYPLVPYLLVCLLVGVQLLPLVAAGFLYGTVISGGIAVHLWEQVFWLILSAMLALWSLRMLTASLFATYIVTLPDMTPMKAYRSARRLVYGRRLLIWRKLLFLPVVFLLFAALVEVPVIMFVTPLAAWAFFVLSVLVLPAAHSYLYNLYREML